MTPQPRSTDAWSFAGQKALLMSMAMVERSEALVPSSGRTRDGFYLRTGQRGCASGVNRVRKQSVRAAG
jgi:hypothetical protein